jgi:hypothetical protein
MTKRIMPPFDPDAMRRAVKKASAALNESLARMRQREQERRANPTSREWESRLALKYHIRTERERGVMEVIAIAARAYKDLGLLPDCPTFLATVTTLNPEAPEGVDLDRDVLWCGNHHCRADHPRWCRVALGFNRDGSL